jgi:hypothetical protein
MSKFHDLSLNELSGALVDIILMSQLKKTIFGSLNLALYVTQCNQPTRGARASLASPVEVWDSSHHELRVGKLNPGYRE